MNVRRLSTRLLLRPEDVPSSRDDFEVVGVFNPGAVRAGDEVVLLARVAERPRERRAGFTGLPRWDPDAGSTIDWVPDAEIWTPVDPRVVRRKADGLVRLTFISHLRVIRCGDGRAVREVTGVTFPPARRRSRSSASRTRGSPRWTAGSTSPTWPCRGTARRPPWPPRPTSARSSGTASSSARRTRTWYCSPSRSAGRYAALHRPVCGTPFTRPEMWVARSPDLLHWGASCRHSPCPAGSGNPAAWEPGPRRCAVADGWLEIYHGNRQPTRQGEVGAYYAGALLLGPDDPSRVLRRTPEPFFVARGRLRGRRASSRTSSSRPAWWTMRRLAPGLLRRRRRLHGGCGVLVGATCSTR